MNTRAATWKEDRARKVASHWNSHYPIGSPVLLSIEDGERIRCTTRSNAIAMLDGTVRVYLNHGQECVQLDKLQAELPPTKCHDWRCLECRRAA